jgi:uncharacterized protein (DUF2147 family)
MIRRAAPLAALAILAAAAPPRAAAPDPARAVSGDWLTEDRTGVIRIAPCPQGLCGSIVGMTEWPANGDVPRDQAGHPQCHETILTMRRADGDPPSWSGTILNPNDGNRYDATLHLAGDGTLRLRGYLLIPLFGASQAWTRYAGPLPADCHLHPGLQGSTGGAPGSQPAMHSTEPPGS